VQCIGTYYQLRPLIKLRAAIHVLMIDSTKHKLMG